MLIWLVIPILCLVSILAVPAGFRFYSRFVRWRHKNGAQARTASLHRVRRAERFWFRLSPFMLLAAGAMALLMGMHGTH